MQYHVTLFPFKVSLSLYCVTSSISDGVENYFLGLWGLGISDAIFDICYTSFLSFFLIIEGLVAGVVTKFGNK